MVKATEKRIYLTRHAQAEHNVTEDYSIVDAPLTPLGREQAASLNESTQHTIQATAELLVTSAMRRALSTTLIAYPTLRKRLEEQGKPIVILPQLQEVNNLPCDTGFPRERLEANPEYTGLDFSHLTPDWTSKQGFYGYDVPTLQARARWNRRWLRERPEKEIVVVAHGDCLRYITEGYNSHAPWENVEVREYTFGVDEEDDVDGEAVLTRVKKVVQDSDQDQSSSSSDRFQEKD